MSLPRFVEALGWALVHSLWQLALLGVVTALVLRGIGHARLRLQHALAFGALVLCLILPVAMFLRAFLATPVPTAGLVFPLDVAPLLGTQVQLAPASAPWTARALERLTHLLPWVASAWAVGTAFMALRLTGGFFTARDWRRQSEPAPSAWEAHLQALAEGMALRGRVALRVSARLASPIAMGLWRPVVLVPLAFFTELPEPYIEALLAHELAHVKRRDYLLNLLQNVIEVLLFHHPTVWWLSRRIRNLREHLADDLAARTIGEPRRLALALDALDDLKSVPSPHPHLALAARGGTLFDRIHRLLIPPTPKPRPAWLPAALLTLALPCAALSLKAATNPPIPGDPQLLQELDALAAKENIDPQLLRSMAWVESGLRRNAKSQNGALGVLQVMPETAKKYGATDVKDRTQVMAAGVKYLRFLLDRYPGDTAKAVAAYNGGEKAIDAGKLSEETRAYFPMVMSVYQAKAVQPAPTLHEGGVDGVVRALSDGTYQISFRISARSGLKLEVVEDSTHGAILGTLSVGSQPGEASTKWSISSPVLRIEKPKTNAIVFRCSDDGIGITGETRLILDAPWKAFAFTMKPKA